MKNKFKVGDRVRCINEVDGNKKIVGKIGTIRVINDIAYQSIGIEFDDKIHDNRHCNTQLKTYHGWWVGKQDIELINNEKIIIYRKDNEVIAKDCNTGKIGVAKCDPRDAFEFEIGAKLALERLTSNVTFKLLCVKSKFPFMTKGKTYEFIDGVTIWDDGIESNPYKSITEFKSRNLMLSKYTVELKDGDDVNEILKPYDPIKKGDKVTVIDIGKYYPTYYMWKGLKGYESHFVANKAPTEKKVYTVLNVKDHAHEKSTLALIQDKDTAQVFIINVEGLKKEV